MNSLMKLGVVVTMRDLMSRGMVKAQMAVKKLEGNVKSLAASGLKWLKVGGMIAAGGALILASFAGPTMAASRFAHKMAEVSTMVDTTKVNMAGLSTGVLNLSQKFGQSSQLMGTAAYNVLSAGISASKSLNVLSLSSKAAIAGVTDVNTAAKLGTNILNAYKMPVSELSHVYDVMFMTVKNGVTTFPELSQYMGEVTSLASTAGVKIEELGAGIATLTKAGIRTPQAMTAMRGLIQGMAAPSSAVGKKIREIGGAAFEAAVKSKDFSGAMSVLFSKVNSLSEIREVMPEIEGMKAFAALKSSFSDYKSLMAQMKNSTGAMEKEFKKMAESPIYKFNQLKSSLSALSITIGNKFLPALKGFLSYLTPLVQGITNWMQKHPVLTGFILKTTAALGAFLLIAGGGAMIIGGLKLALAALPIVLGIVKAAWIGATTAVWSFTTALLANPITWIVVGIVALGYAIYKVIKHWNFLKKVFTATAEVMKEKLNKVPDWLLMIIPGIGQVLLAFKHWDKIKNITSKVFSSVKGFAISAFEKIKSVVSKAPDWLLNIIPGIGQVLLAFKHWDKIKEIVSNVFSYIPKLFDNVIAWVVNKFSSFINAFIRPINEIRKKMGYEPIQLRAKVSAEDIAKSRKELGAIYKEGLGEAGRIASNAWKGVKNTFSDVTKGAKSAVSDTQKVMDNLKGGNKSVKLSGNWRELFKKAENFGKGLTHGFMKNNPQSLNSIANTTKEITTNSIKAENQVTKASWQKSTTNNSKTVATSSNKKIVNLSGINIHINGAQDPEAVGKEVRKQLQLIMEMG